MTPKKALITDSVHNILIEDIEKAGYLCTYLPNIQQQEVEKIIAEYEILIINSKINVDKQFLNKAEKLKIIGRLGSGMEIVDIPYAESKGIKVYNSPEGNRDAVAEHAIGMLLGLFNQLIYANNEVKNFIWQREQRRGEELKGKTIGLIGYGNTGKVMAKKLYGFDVQVLFYDKYLKTEDDKYAKQVNLQDIYNEAEVLSFHVPYNKETHYYFSEGFINKMKHPFYLINTSRGKVVNTKDLTNGLNNKKILGACLDVFENEKLQTYTNEEKKMYEELFSHKNVIVSPHIAGWTHQSKYKLAKILSNKILGNAYLD
ncbi:MAG: hypothetical protein H6578_08830 [Chitinophagales bacterium]|nr:hypothetical protein [Chitinophagales bacterium]